MHGLPARAENRIKSGLVRLSSLSARYEALVCLDIQSFYIRGQGGQDGHNHFGAAFGGFFFDAPDGFLFHSSITTFAMSLSRF